MGLFVFYFLICLLALLVRGYYRVPSSCILHQIIDKEENTMKSIIADRIECKCHYTNFLWNNPSIDQQKAMSLNFTLKETDTETHFEVMALVRMSHGDSKQFDPFLIFHLDFKYSRWTECSRSAGLFALHRARILLSTFQTRFIHLCQRSHQSPISSFVFSDLGHGTRQTDLLHYY